MIGNLPDTLEDRALVVRLRRKRDGEAVERFRADRINDFLPLRQMAARWAKDNALTLANADPPVPAALHDRAQDNARCICAIADAVGGHWPVTIRAALVGMHHEVEADEPQSAGVLLLRDVAEIFEAKRAERIGSTDLLNALCALEESPWNEWRGGRPISTCGIAKLLKPYGISPRRDRANNVYALSNFSDAFNRYLSQGGRKTLHKFRKFHLPPILHGKIQWNQCWWSLWNLWSLFRGRRKQVPRWRMGGRDLMAFPLSFTT